MREMREMRAAIVGGLLVLAGVGLGAIVFGSEPADAQARGFRTCVFGRQETHDIDGAGVWERQDINFAGDRVIQIPAGWELVGGAGGTPHSSVVLICR